MLIRVGSRLWFPVSPKSLTILHFYVFDSQADSLHLSAVPILASAPRPTYQVLLTIVDIAPFTACIISSAPTLLFATPIITLWPPAPSFWPAFSLLLRIRLRAIVRRTIVDLVVDPFPLNVCNMGAAYNDVSKYAAADEDEKAGAEGEETGRRETENAGCRVIRKIQCAGVCKHCA